ncbi:MAG TPA: HK97 family phage prohead protease [Usitatibacter sp.]|jgi:hypothetical protein|nr:HK97 family phage prohead protease [Usitatibacter sp.]
MESTARAICEFKFSGSAEQRGAFSGHGAAFGNVDSYGDVIQPGAFSAWLSDVKSGRQPWPAMLSQHGGMLLTSDDMTPVGVWTDIAEDAKGLAVHGQLAETPRGTELATLLTMKPRPAIDGMSIGYIAKEWEPRSKPEDPRRKLKRIDVMEISLVTFPANRSARITNAKDSIRDFEHALVDRLGLSAREAKRAASAAWPALARQEDQSAELEQLAERLRRNIALARQPIY